MSELRKYLWIAFISMLPLIELRGAIPVSQALGLPLLPSYVVCIIANMVPIPFIYFFAHKVLLWGKDKPAIGPFFRFCLEKGEKGGRKLMKTAGEHGTFVALFLFVAIPVPGTGAWTGTLAASILDLGFRRSIIAVLCGVLTAGIIMGLVSMGFFGAVGTLG
ncbi:MAG: small multi-drug export protein [Atopobiaceae bacterium]|nr:small multi-drug export protein [Atopobiaceae bacterium]MBQ3283582.1 small multi-drug export protein [Atopobiaceae bacterium]MBQ6651442.1 small multi-drug export protein [Atopobiaceae bacterium]